MSKEWNSPWNSFNSYKGLLYSKHYEAINDWKKGKREAPLPPIEVSLDPINACNLLCQHCNAHKYLTDVDKSRRMTDAHLMELITFLAKWGVKGVCFGGGGEPTLHTKLKDALLLSKELGMENSIATNGTCFDNELIDTATRTCRWIGVSVDSANFRTYMKGRNKNLFSQTIFCLEKLVDNVKKNKLNCDVAYKFLIFDYNQKEIFKACKLAKSIGVKDFHVRPADFRHQGLGEWQKKNNLYDIKLIGKQFEQCHELEDENFRVFTVTHKFNDDFTPRRKFTECYASPICLQLCPNGDMYLCPDTRYIDFYKLGIHTNPEDIPNIWGNKNHYNLVFRSGCKNCHSRCTFNPYNEQCERLFINKDDPMCKNFV